MEVTNLPLVIDLICKELTTSSLDALCAIAYILAWLNTTPSKVDASHVLDLLLSGLCLAFYTIALHVLAWLTRRLQYLMPCMYLLGCCLADASPSILDASHVPAWLWLG